MDFSFEELERLRNISLLNLVIDQILYGRTEV